MTDTSSHVKVPDPGGMSCGRSRLLDRHVRTLVLGNPDPAEKKGASSVIESEMTAQARGRC